MNETALTSSRQARGSLAIDLAWAIAPRWALRRPAALGVALRLRGGPEAQACDGPEERPRPVPGRHLGCGRPRTCAQWAAQAVCALRRGNFMAPRRRRKVRASSGALAVDAGWNRGERGMASGRKRSVLVRTKIPMETSIGSRPRARVGSLPLPRALRCEDGCSPVIHRAPSVTVADLGPWATRLHGPRSLPRWARPRLASRGRPHAIASASPACDRFRGMLALVVARAPWMRTAEARDGSGKLPGHRSVERHAPRAERAPACGLGDGPEAPAAPSLVGPQARPGAVFARSGGGSSLRSCAGGGRSC
jgi:hypothetical protein